MACISEIRASEVAKDESIQGFARNLCEGETLPHGFSENTTEAAGNDVSVINLSKESSTLQQGRLVPKDESLQELAKKLPEGDALPDGFSECFTEPSGNYCTAADLSKESSTFLENEVYSDETIDLLEKKTESHGITVSLPEEFPDAYEVTSIVAGQRFSSDSSDVLVELNDGSPCSSPSERKKGRREKLRRFPVQLSDKDSLDHPNEELGGNVNQSSVIQATSLERPCSGSDFNTWSDVNTTSSATMQTTSANTNDVPDSCASQGRAEKPCIDNGGDCPGRETTRTFKRGEVEAKNASIGNQVLHSCETVHVKEHGALAKDKLIETKKGVRATSLEEEVLYLRCQNEQLLNEKKSSFAELTKSLLIREKLESLCRELQRQNKQLTDECKRIASEEQQKRLDLSTRFHDAIKDVTIKLEEQGDERLRQIKENEMLQEKLRHFTQQYEFQEQQYTQQLRTKSLEQQLLEVKLKQQEELFKQGEAKIHLYTEQIAQLLKTEQDLRGRLALYGDKFEQFQDTLTKSNEVFASFKIEMEKMSKTIKTLEKENLSLKKKVEKLDVSLIELVDERESLKKQLETARKQKEKLEALCRSLQAERKQHNLAISNAVASAAAKGSASLAAPFKSEQEDN